MPSLRVCAVGSCSSRSAFGRYITWCHTSQCHWVCCRGPCVWVVCCCCCCCCCCCLFYSTTLALGVWGWLGVGVHLDVCLPHPWSCPFCSQDIHTELDLHANLLEEIDAGVDKTSGNIKTQTKKVEGILEETSACNCCGLCTIFLLFLVIVLLIFVNLCSFLPYTNAQAPGCKP
jgi:hypothetical protein